MFKSHTKRTLIFSTFTFPTSLNHQSIFYLNHIIQQTILHDFLNELIPVETLMKVKNIVKLLCIKGSESDHRTSSLWKG